MNTGSSITKAHIENFKEWAQKAKIDGFLEASENMLDAANKIKEANEYLQKAKAGLFH